MSIRKPFGCSASVLSLRAVETHPILRTMIGYLTAALAVSVATAFAPSSVSRTSATIQTKSLSSSAPSAITTQLSAQLLQDQDITEKYYFPSIKEAPKVLGGLKIGLRELAVVTGASSGLGLNCAATLAKSGKYFVVMACRDVEKAKRGE
jgi:protochlorophyllide reductase